MYVMNTKLTLRMDKNTIEHAKLLAERRGTSVSRMFSDVVDTMMRDSSSSEKTTPLTSSLHGILKNAKVDEKNYKEYLANKHIKQ